MKRIIRARTGGGRRGTRSRRNNGRIVRRSKTYKFMPHI
jgi:hypothetical protein